MNFGKCYLFPACFSFLSRSPVLRALVKGTVKRPTLRLCSKDHPQDSPSFSGPRFISNGIIVTEQCSKQEKRTITNPLGRHGVTAVAVCCCGLDMTCLPKALS